RTEASITGPSNLRRLKRAWKSPLSFFLERALVRPDEAGGNDCANHGDDEGGDGHRPRIMLKGAAQQEAAQAKDRRPTHPARSIEETELFPIVTIDAGQERRESPQHRDKAAEKDDFSAVPEEEILADFEPLLIKSNIMPIAIDERKAELAANPIAAIVAED